MEFKDLKKLLDKDAPESIHIIDKRNGQLVCGILAAARDDGESLTLNHARTYDPKTDIFDGTPSTMVIPIEGDDITVWRSYSNFRIRAGGTMTRDWKRTVPDSPGYQKFMAASKAAAITP